MKLEKYEIKINKIKKKEELFMLNSKALLRSKQTPLSVTTQKILK